MPTLTVATGTAHAFPLLRLLPLFPLAGAALNLLLGKPLQDRLGRRAVHAIAIAAMLGAATIAIVGFARLIGLDAHARTLTDEVMPMLHVGMLRVDFALLLDPLSSVMTLVITLVGALIHVYATGYMADEPSAWRFFGYLNLFVFAMLLLVLGENFLVMFFGWEGVGLASYLLIGFWYRERKNAAAGMKAFVVNRVGDFGFLTGVMLLFWGLGGSWSEGDGKYTPEIHPAVGDSAILLPDPAVNQAFVRAGVVAGEATESAGAAFGGAERQVAIGPTLSFPALHDQLALRDASGARPVIDGGTMSVYVEHRERAEGREALLSFEGLAHKEVFGLPLLFLVALCLFIGATGKSAQLPLYVWLPDAMAGPTPVSALIHAATMVTAGVYMVARLGFLFVLSPGAMTIVATVGALTALFAATIGLFQYDIKKVLAYSTVSQLGFMFIGVGVGAFAAGTFHLVTHALFKACLFLGAGSVIHAMHALTHARAHAHHHTKGSEDAEHGAVGDDEHKPSVGAGDNLRTDPRLAPDPTDPQDLRNMGGLAALMPRTRWTYLIACWAIAGFPMAAGFYSKDEILFRAFGNGSTVIPGAVLWAIGVLAATCTSFYMFRSYYLAFHHRPLSDEHKAHVHESPASMTAVLVVLAAACLVVGPLLGLPGLFAHPLHLPAVFERWLEPVLSLADASLAGARAFAEGAGLEGALMLVSVGVAVAGWLAARALYLDASRAEARRHAWKQRYASLHRLVFEKYRVDEIYYAIFIRNFARLARAAAWVDATIIDGIVNLTARISLMIARLDGAFDTHVVDGAVNLVADGVIASGRGLRKVQTGRINQYVLIAAAGLVTMVIVAWLAA